MTSISTVATTDKIYSPDPTARPMAATDQMLAAVVRPWILKPERRMVPAPRKPTPVTIWAATLAGSHVGNAKEDGYDGEQSGPRRHQGQDPQASQFLRLLTLKADDSTKDGGQDQADSHLSLRSHTEPKYSSNPALP